MDESQTSPLARLCVPGGTGRSQSQSYIPAVLRPGTRDPLVPRSVEGLGWGLPVTGHQEDGSVEPGLLPAVVLTSTAGPGTLLFFLGRPGPCF